VTLGLAGDCFSLAGETIVANLTLAARPQITARAILN